MERLQVRLDFSIIRAPFKGVITKRYLSPGAYVEAPAQGEKAPVFAIDRTDQVRVVVPIPDRHVPFADKGDPAKVEIENLGGKVFDARISRIQGAEDQADATMRVEIDLPNPKDELRPGMFAKVTVNLEHLDRALVLPSGCLVGEAEGRQGPRLRRPRGGRPRADPHRRRQRRRVRGAGGPDGQRRGRPQLQRHPHQRWRRAGRCERIRRQQVTDR